MKKERQGLISGVTRIIQPRKRMKGWWVRIGWVEIEGVYRPVFTRYFSEHKYGPIRSRQEAEAFARKTWKVFGGMSPGERRAMARARVKERA